jgi:hypothetical protein
LNWRGAKVGLPFLALRLVFQNRLWTWNSDIQSAIIPGLQCWYCQPSQAPYGVLWHIISSPLALGGTPYFYTFGATLGDYLAMTLMGKKQILPMYGMLSFWIWLQAPYDIPILWLTLLGLLKWPLAFLGPIGKLPFGSELCGFHSLPGIYCYPLQTWNFALSRHYIGSDFQYYALMGMVFILVLVQSRSDRRTQNGKNDLDS